MYAPDEPDPPDTYFVLRDRVENLSQEERREALAVVAALERRLTVP